jgi:hypothetical protein
MRMKAKLTGIRAKASPAKKKKLCDRYAEVLRLRQMIIETQSSKPTRDARLTTNRHRSPRLRIVYLAAVSAAAAH